MVRSKDQGSQGIKAYKGIIVLSLIMIVSLLLLSWVDSMTRPVIEENRRQQSYGAISELFPESSNFERRQTETSQGIIDYYEIYDEDTLIGYALSSQEIGYQSSIIVMVGFDTDRQIKSVAVIEQSETPGLGTKITQGSFLSQFVGMDKDDAFLRQDGGEIDAISGATISSEAVVRAVQDSFEKIKIALEQRP